METCIHVGQVVMSVEHSILDPKKWLCAECGTTEWVWACLSCSHVACGRLNEKHAVEHFEATKHPLAIEINEKYVFCYVCDEYILGDNAKGDIEAIRTALTAIGTLSLEEVEKKGSKLLRSYSHQQEFSRSQADDDDRLITADTHFKKALLGRVFTAWQNVVQKEKESGATVSEPARMLTRSRSGLFHLKKRTLIPGVSGLRNLGNTCYINSIIQALSHLEDFREFFCHLVFGLFSPSSTPLLGTSSASNSPLAARQLIRLNTIDYFQHLSQQPSKPAKEAKAKSPVRRKEGGLNGGQAEAADGSCNFAMDWDVTQAKAEMMRGLSLCQELHGLLRVLWSGKWAQVSPHGFLQAVWRAIPIFKGHSQHDAQEFLCELLDKVSREIEDLPQCKDSQNIVDHSFRGELISQVTCLSCKNVSACYEPFLDLSLEFPPIFQQTNSHSLRNMCHVTEMLSKFTEVEELEPKSYGCEKCAKKRSNGPNALKKDAKKQLLINRPPEILQLHLKRFRWCGRNHREKINTHVAFDEELDISSFCKAAPSIARYRLNAVVVHHGAGFRAGHYTTYNYNNDAESWVHCNDARVQMVSVEEVLLSQAYILFYTRELSSLTLDELPVLDPVNYTLETHSTVSTMPELDRETVHTLQQFQEGEMEQAVDDEVSISFRRDPTLIRRFSSFTSNPDLKRSATAEVCDINSPAPSASSASPAKKSHRNSESPLS